MGKRGKKLMISHEDRLQEIKNHNIFDEKGNIKKLSDPIWSVICDNLNMKQTAKEMYIQPKNLHSYVLRHRDSIKLETNASEVTSSTDSECSLKCNADKIEKSLISISNNVLYKPIVQELAFYPLSIFHGAILAINFVSDLAEDSNFIFASIGPVCKSFITTNTNIFLYSFGTILFNKFIPICQISAERISISSLNSFLNKLLMNGLPIPRRVTVHHSWIHYKSMNSSFNVNVSYEDYLNTCFRNLTEDTDYSPRCVINTDIRLLILKIKKWDCVQNKSLESVRLFYLYCVIMLSNQDNVNNFQDILQKIFVMTYSPFQSEHTKSCFKDIMTEIKKHKIDITYSKKNIEEIENTFQFMLELENNKTNYIIYSKCPTIYYYLTNIFAKAKQFVTSDNGSDNRNAYYNPDFCKLLIQLSMEFVLWTKVMLKDSYSSYTEETEFALVESYKEGFKGHLTKNIPNSDITVDEYLLENIEYANNILEAAINLTTTKKINKVEKINPEITYLYHEENWGGLNKQEELECSSSSSQDSESSDNNDLDNVSSEDECSDNEIKFSEVDVSTLITSICETYINDSVQNKIVQENKKEGTNMDTAMMKLKDTIVTPITSSIQEHEDMDISYLNFEHDIKVSTSSPGVHNKNEPSVLSSKDDTLHHDVPQLFKKDASMNVKRAPKGKTKRGKYLQPCEEIHLLNQKPLHKPRKRKTIKNYNEFAPKKINGVKHIIKTSSYFDCTMEIFTTAYYTIQKFQTFVINKEKDNEFLAILHNYASTFNTRALYSARASIIANICNPSSSYCYTWTRSIGEFYGELMGSNVYKQMSCEVCNVVTYQHYNRINLTREQVINEHLSKIIYDSLQGQNKCENCGDKLHLKKLEINNILCIDIEDSIKNNMNSIELNKLIPTITIDEKTLILIGIVAFEVAIRQTDSRHYIAYCRSVEGSWYEYNDCHARNGAPKVKDSFKLNVALLYYIEYDTLKVVT